MLLDRLVTVQCHNCIMAPLNGLSDAERDTADRTGVPGIRSLTVQQVQ